MCIINSIITYYVKVLPHKCQSSTLLCRQWYITKLWSDQSCSHTVVKRQSSLVIWSRACEKPDGKLVIFHLNFTYSVPHMRTDIDMCTQKANACRNRHACKWEQSIHTLLHMQAFLVNILDMKQPSEWCGQYPQTKCRTSIISIWERLKPYNIIFRLHYIKWTDILPQMSR